MSTQIKNKIGPGVIYLLSFLPVTFWVLMKPLDERFFGLTGWLTSLGQLSGLIGLAMISSAMVLMARWQWLEDYFDGLDKMYRSHHFFNSLGFILILFHPLVLAGKFLIFSTQSAALFLLPDVFWPKTVGLAALLGLTIFLILSIFSERISYQARKLSHKILGLVFVLALLHAFFAASDIARYWPLRIYMLFLAIIALITFIYRGVLSRWLVKKYDYAVAEVRVLSGRIIEIEMQPCGEALKFSSGQFAFFSFQQSGIGAETHPFTIASSPSEKNLKIAVKGLGDYTKKLLELKPGAAVKIEGPFGHFGFKDSEYYDQIWIAGGIGITPFLSLARSLAEDKKVDLYYTVSTRSDAVFLEEFKEIANNKNNFQVKFYFSDQQPCRLNAEIVQKTSGGLTDKKILLCGPLPMMTALRKQFKELNVPEEMVRSEEFQLL